MPETPETDSKDVVNADLPKWRQKAQKRISQTSLNTFKVMKQKWQVLAKFKAQSTAELKVSVQIATVIAYNMKSVPTIEMSAVYKGQRMKITLNCKQKLLKTI